MKKLLPALVLCIFASAILKGQDTNFVTKGFHITADPHFIDYAVRQPDGKFLISGIFHRFDNKPVTNLLRFTSQGELDTTFKQTAGTDQNIFAISAHQDGSIFLAGNFTQYQNQRVPIPFIKIAANGDLDASFYPQLSGILAYGISAIQALPNGKVLVAGRGIDPDHPDLSTIMRLNKNGSKDQSFKQNFSDEFIAGIQPGPDSTIIVFGNFRTWNSTSATGIVRLKSTGVVDPGFILQGTALQPAFNGWTSVSQVIVTPDSGLLVTGNFDYYNTEIANKIVKLRKDGSRDPGFKTDPAIYPTWLDNLELLTDGTIVLSGSISVNGVYKWFVKLKEDGSLFSSNSFVGPDQQPATFGSKRLFAVGEGEFIAVGWFTGRVNGVDVGVFNKFNAHAQPYLNHLLPFSRKGLIVETAVDSAHRIIVVGSFNQYGDDVATRRNYIARLLPNGSIDPDFKATGSNGYIGAVALQKNGKIVVAGNFTELNGTAHNGIGRFNDDGSVDLTFNPGAGPDDRNMYDVHVSSTQQIYVTGSFRKFNSQPHQAAAKLNTDGSVDHAFTTAGLGVIAPNSIITLPDGKVLYGESSSHTVRFFDKPMRVYKVDSLGTPDPLFNPPVMDYTVTKKVRVGSGEAIYWLGTIFHDNNNPTRVDQPIVKLNPDGTLDSIAYRNLPSNLFINDFEVLPNNKLVIACRRIGRYDSLDVVMRLNPDLTIDSSFVPVGLLYSLEHINFDGNDKIIVAGEPKRAFRLENEQVQNIAIITKNNFKLETNTSVIKNMLDTALLATGDVGATTEQLFKITNTGNTTINLLDPSTGSLSGLNSSDFSIRTGTSATALKPSESLEFTVRFSPTAAGQKSAQLTIPFSDGVQQLYAIPISATAKAGAVTSVGDVTDDSGMRIYPNPLQGTSINIVSEQLVRSYELIDVSGHVIQKGILRGQGTYTIQLKKAIKGLVFLKLRTEKKEVITKLITL